MFDCLNRRAVALWLKSVTLPPLFLFFPQPGDDIVFMAQTLEKAFLQKLSQMQKGEVVTTVSALEPLKMKKNNTGDSEIGYFMWISFFLVCTFIKNNVNQ